MREILFRGKKTKDGEWVEGYYQECPKDFVHIQNTSNDWFPVFPESVGQFTGFTDKNGKRIFEGDIILICGRGPGVIEFCKYSFWRCRNKNIGPYWSHRLDDEMEYEIIGNIYDNPELLEAIIENVG